MSLWATIEKKVKGGEVGDKISPELRVDRMRHLEKSQVYACVHQDVRINIFFCRVLSKECVRTKPPADLNEEPCAGCIYAEFAEKRNPCIDAEMIHKVAQYSEIQIDKPVKFG